MTPSDRHTRAVTIYDVASAAGVSASTVSRTFSRPGRVSAGTALRVHRAAERLGYRNRPAAGSLPTVASGMLALLVSDVTNPVFAPIVRSATATANERGYTMLLIDTAEAPRAEREALDRVVEVVEGVVMGSSRLSDAALRKIADRRPMVILNRGASGFTSVVADHGLGMRQVAEHLAGLGHEAITYVAGPETSWADGMRWRGLRAAALGLGLRVQRVGPCPPTIAGGVAAVEAFLARPTTAVAAFNDLLAIGVMRRLARHGTSVPSDVSVVGFDKIFGSDFGRPSLTTVAAPLDAMGSMAVELLLDHLGAGGPRAAEAVVVPTRLVERSSTAHRSR